MGSSEINKDNIITATIEELSEEERKAYLLLEEHVKEQFLKGFKKDRGGLVKRVEEHVKEQFLKGFKKDRGGLVKRVEEFVLASHKLNKAKIEEIPNLSTSSSDMFEK